VSDLITEPGGKERGMKQLDRSLKAAGLVAVAVIAIGFPKALRSRAYFAANSQAPRARPIICAPMPMRPSFRVSIAIL